MASINFNTSNDTFRALLGNGVTYKVPSFQRDYSWTQDEWEDLWQDILALLDPDGEQGHYMGYLVLQSTNNKRFSIIDGQQRLTTLSVMILAALGHLKKLIEKDLDASSNTQRKTQLMSSYIGYLDPVTLVSQSKLELNRHNNAFYQTYLVPLTTIPQRNLNASEHLLRKAFLWFQEKIEVLMGSTFESGKNIAIFIDTLVDKLFFTVIKVNDELNAFKVFETLNARGVRLSSTDLLKNHLFSIISFRDTHENEIKNMEILWERVVELLGSEGFPEFLRVYWNSKNKLVRKADLFKVMRKDVSTREQVFALLRALDNAAAAYAALRDTNDAQWNADEKNSIDQLMMYNVRQPLSMLLACHARFYNSDRKAFSRILRFVSVISFRYNVICNQHPNEQEGLYNDIARKISSGIFNDTKEIQNALLAVYPDDDMFKQHFSKKEFITTNSRNKKIVRYIFIEIEKQRSGSAFSQDTQSYNLEHILPEHPSESWAYIDDATQERLIYRLGNMTLLETSRNRDLGNADYATKKHVYGQSVFQLTKDVDEHYAAWNEEDIESRQKSLAKTAAGIWRINF